MFKMPQANAHEFTLVDEVPQLSKSSRSRYRKHDEKRRRELILAYELWIIAGRYPDSYSVPDINKLINRVRTRAASNPAKRRNIVVEALSRSLPPETVEDIAEETGLERAEVKAALEELISAPEGLVETWTRGGKRNSGRSGTTIYYRLKEGASILRKSGT